ncbi:MAG: hypothetical protein IJG33_15290 [Selenomonadaceae bacterium]|nr:hypothetical protein [Selenomonadaceae bacterium]
MIPYKKPTIVGYNATRGIIPLAGVAIGAPAILSALGGVAAGALAASTGAAAAATGISFGAAAAAAAAGVAAGAAATKLAGKITLMEPVFALTDRKDFALG